MATQSELIQLQDNHFLAQSWREAGSKEELSKSRFVYLDLDLRKEIGELRNGDFQLRSNSNKNPDIKTGEEFHRKGYLLFATGDQADWIGFPRQAMNGVYADNAINRLCEAFSIAFTDNFIAT